MSGDFYNAKKGFFFQILALGYTEGCSITKGNRYICCILNMTEAE